jgi:hypothetical protein
MSITTQDRARIEINLELCFNNALSNDLLNIPTDIETNLLHIFTNIDTATSGYLNLLTCLICTSVDNSVDPRFHRKPGNGMPKPINDDGWFSGRVISEKILYPWLEIKGLRTAKSG